MKSIFYKFLNLITFINNVVFPQNIINVYTIFRNLYYTSLLSHKFNFFGKNTIIQKKISLHGAKYIKIGDNCNIGNNGFLTAWSRHRNNIFNPQIIINNNVSIGSDFHITAINLIVIEDNVLIGKKVTITDNSHGSLQPNEFLIPPAHRLLFSKGPVIIKKNVWIGDKVTILPKVIIGENAIIGANSVVTKDVPDNCIVGGIPAKIIKKFN